HSSQMSRRKLKMHKNCAYNDHNIAEFHRARKYSVRWVVVPTLDEVEIVNSRHFLAVSCLAIMIEAGRDLPPYLVFGSPLKVHCPPIPRFQGLLQPRHGTATSMT